MTSLSKDTTQLLAESLVFVSDLRPNIPGMSPRSSALHLMSAFIRAESQPSTENKAALEKLVDMCDFEGKCRRLISSYKSDGVLSEELMTMMAKLDEL